MSIGNEHSNAILTCKTLQNFRENLQKLNEENFIEIS